MVYDIECLNDIEVQELRQSIKTAIEKIPIEQPLFGKIKDDTIVEGHFDKIKYKLHRYRHPIDDTRFSISLRFSQTNDTLIRIDINNGTHKNPDGTIAPNNHIHIYKDSDTNKKDAFATSLPGEFKNIKNIFEALDDFLRYNNIR